MQGETAKKQYPVSYERSSACTLDLFIKSGNFQDRRVKLSFRRTLVIML